MSAGQPSFGFRAASLFPDIISVTPAKAGSSFILWIRLRRDDDFDRA
jgi:hypothetical protein